MRELLQPLSSHVEEGAESVVIRFSGSSLALTHDYALVLDSLLRHITVHAGRREVVLDFSNVTCVSSTGLGVLVALHKRLLDRGGRLVVFDLNDAMYDAFEDAGLISVLDDRCGAPALCRPGPSVLVVDDNELVRELLAGALRRRGLQVLLAGCGQEAVEQCRNNPGAIALALLDVNMPGRLSGPATLAVLRTICPHLTCCFMTGDPRPSKVEALQALGAVRVFAKPFRVSAIAEVLQDLATGAAVSTRNDGQHCHEIAATAPGESGPPACP
jgi:anti-anti-sigma factor